MLTRLIKLLLSLAYFFLFSIVRFIKQLLGFKNNPICVVLYYHSIFPNEKENFEWQMNLLKRKSNVIKSDIFEELNPHKLYTVLTFDDGFENLLQNAIPVMQKLHLPFTIFFITNYFGKKPGWEFPEGHYDKNEKIMTVDQVKSVSNELLTIGSHTENHVKLTHIDLKIAEKEIVNSKNTLENISGKSVDIISFPNGDYNSQIINKCFEVGYKRVFTIEPKLAFQNKNEKITGRVWTNGNDWKLEYFLKVNGAYCWLNNIFLFKRKLLG